jgi:hypothetical protein
MYIVVSHGQTVASRIIHLMTEPIAAPDLISLNVQRMDNLLP